MLFCHTTEEFSISFKIYKSDNRKFALMFFTEKTLMSICIFLRLVLIFVQFPISLFLTFPYQFVRPFVYKDIANIFQVSLGFTFYRFGGFYNLI